MAVIEQGIQEAGWGPGVSSFEDGACGQRDRALQRANEARMDGAAVKRELRVGVLELAGALADPRAGSVKVGDLVLCVPGIGAVGPAAAARARDSGDETGARVDGQAAAGDQRSSRRGIRRSTRYLPTRAL